MIFLLCEILAVKHGLVKLLFSTVMVLLFVSTTYGQWLERDHSRVRLLSEYQTVNGQSPFWLLVEFDLQPGWHTYWQNPGDSGKPPQFQWHLPDGWQASPIHWLPPKKIPAGPFINYGYKSKAYHLVKIKPNPVTGKGIIQIELKADWLICEVECIPDEADLVLNLQAGQTNDPSDDFDRINTLVGKTRLPKLNATWLTDKDSLKLSFKPPMQGNYYFFPKQHGLIEPSEEQKVSVDKDMT